MFTFAWCLERRLTVSRPEHGDADGPPPPLGVAAASLRQSSSHLAPTADHRQSELTIWTDGEDSGQGLALPLAAKEDHFIY